jgi:hypothetical protein
MPMPFLKSASHGRDSLFDLLIPYVSFLLSPPICLKFCIYVDDDPSLAENSDSPTTL